MVLAKEHQHSSSVICAWAMMPLQGSKPNMPSEQPNTRRVEELQEQIKHGKDKGEDVTALEQELETLKQSQGSKPQGGQSQGGQQRR